MHADEQKIKELILNIFSDVSYYLGDVIVAMLYKHDIVFRLMAVKRRKSTAVDVMFYLK